MNDTTTRSSQVHNTFVIERDLDAPVDAAWHAFSDDDARQQWFGADAAFDRSEMTHDFRVGGGGVEDGQWHGGPTSRFVSTYTDIVEHERIVFTYDMWVDGRHLSTSITTVAFEPLGTGDRTRLTYTEQGVHFDGLDSPEGREEGTGGILDAFEAHLAEFLSSRR
jgi:uncharacterized protein YndB with AHSA1/START domain